MEKTKKVTVKDIDGKTQRFLIRLFDVEKGLDFIDRYLTSENKSIKPFLADLLPLATLLDATGVNEVDVMSLDKAKVYFENPFAVIELGLEILEHQKVFMKESEVFQPFLALLEKKSAFQTSGSQI